MLRSSFAGGFVCGAFALFLACPVTAPGQGDPVLPTWESGYGIFRSGSFSPNQAVVATVGNRGVLLWDSGDGSLLQHLDAESEFWHTEFSPDGSRLLAASAGRAHVYETTTWSVMSSIEPPPGTTIYSAAWSPDSTTLAFGSTAGEVFFFDSATGDPDPSLVAGEAEDILGGLAFAPGKTHLLAGSFDGAARVWDLSNGDVVWEDTVHTDSRDLFRQSVAFSSDGTQCLVAAYDSVGLFDAETGNRIETFTPENMYRYTMVDFLPGDDAIVMTGRNRISTFSIDNAETPLVSRQIPAFYAGTPYWPSPDGTRLVGEVNSNVTNPVGVVDVATGDTITRLGRHTHHGMAGGWMTIPGAFWNLDSVGGLDYLEGATGAATPAGSIMRYSDVGHLLKDGFRLVSNRGLTPNSLALFHMPSGAMEFEIPLFPDQNPGSIGALAVSCDESLALAGFQSSGKVALVDLTTWELIGELTYDQPARDINGVAISHDSTLAAAAQNGGFVYIWSLDTMTLLHTVRLPVVPGTPLFVDPLYDVAFSHNDRYLLIGGMSAHGVFDLVEEELVLNEPNSLAGHIYSVAWVGDGTSYLVAGSSRINLHAFPSGELLKSFRHRINAPSYIRPSPSGICFVASGFMGTPTRFETGLPPVQPSLAMAGVEPTRRYHDFNGDMIVDAADLLFY